MKNTILYLFGFPATGKYTIAKEIIAQEKIRLVDNHLVNNAVFSLVRDDGKTKLPPEIWDYTARLQDVIFDAIINLVPKEKSFLFTNCLYNEYPPDNDLFEKIHNVAKQRDSLFVPVRLSCDLPELQRRIVSENRNDRMKWMDPDGLTELHQKRTIFHTDHPCKLELDVTDLQPQKAASAILEHVKKLQMNQ